MLLGHQFALPYGGVAGEWVSGRRWVSVPRIEGCRRTECLIAWRCQTELIVGESLLQRVLLC